jgi:hypothetical protein
MAEPYATEASILRRAKKLLEPTGQLAPPYRAALDASGNEADHLGPLAVCWCPVAAIYKVGRGLPGAADRAEQLLSDAVGGRRVADFHVSATYDEVHAAFDRAITSAEAA